MEFSILTANCIFLNVFKIDENFKNVCGIYIIYNKINKKCYVGQTKNLYKRCKEHINSLNNNYHYNKYLQRSYNKYGSNNFDVYGIEIVNNESRLNECELKYIKLLQSRIYKYGYNVKLDTYNRIDENPSGNKGIVLPSKRRAVVQLDFNGNFINRYDCATVAESITGIHWSNISDCCKKQRGNAGGYIWIYEDEYKSDSFDFNAYINNLPVKKLRIRSVAKRDKNKNKINKDYTVIQMDLDGNIIREFKRPSQAKEFGFNPNKIYECCSGRIKTHKGYIWIYKKDFDSNIKYVS